MKIQKYLENNQLIFDGAMATYLHSRYLKNTKLNCEEENLLHPEWIKEIHQEYLEAGAVAIKTNTFMANKKVLGCDSAKLKEIICAAWKNAKEAANQYENRFVFADIGPVPVCEECAAFEDYKEIVDIFIECGAQHFLFETMENLDGLAEIFSYIKKKQAESFIMVSFASSPEGYTRAGYLARKLFYNMQENEDVDAVGFNCISGPKHLLELVKKIAKNKIKKYITIMPNAGYPSMQDNRIYYGDNTDYLGKILYEMVQNGASIVGGCCGTTPKDIQMISEILQKKPIKPVVLADSDENHAKIHHAGEKLDASLNPQNELAVKLKNGEKVIVVELDPPIEPDIDFFMEGAARYKYAGVDAIDIADCPIAKARIDSSILACKLARELHITAIPHMTCRDRNINATKALLLGLNMEGVNNVLTVTGDPVPVAIQSEIKTVFSYNSAVLARHIHSFNQETFAENPFMVSGALNINALNFDTQINHAKKKIENGVNLLFTQPVLSKRGFENLKKAKELLPVKILGGIMPVVSYRNACFMNNEMAGISIEEEIIQQYKGLDRTQGEQLAYELSRDIIDKIENYVDGYYVITPFKRVELVLKIIDYIRKK